MVTFSYVFFHLFGLMAWIFSLSVIYSALFWNNLSSLNFFTVIKAKVTFKSEQDHSEGSVFFQLANQTQPIKSLKDKLFLLFNSIWINIFQDAKTVQTVDFTKIPFPSSDFISRFCQDRRWGKLNRFKTRGQSSRSSDRKRTTE